MPEKPTETVPDELLLLALSAAARKPPTTDIYDLIDYDLDEHEAMERALTAVRPVIRDAARAEVADQVRALADRYRKAADNAENLGQSWDGISTAMFLDELADQIHPKGPDHA